MRFNQLASPTAFALSLAACGPDTAAPTTATEPVDPTTSTSADGTSASADLTSGSSNGDASGPGGTGGSSTAAATGESTTAGVFDPADCRTAVTESDCEAVGEKCQWRTAYRVTDLDTCTLEPAPDLQCWSRYLGAQNCVFNGPIACVELGIAPRYREVDGELQVLDFRCSQGPEDIASDPPGWEICRTDEFEPVPPVCYCLCGGPPGE